MAEALLKSWNAPSTVTSVIINAPSRVIIHAENTQLSKLSADKTGISWDQLDASLPMPVHATDPVVGLVLNSSDFYQAVDSEPLTIAGLRNGKYDLSIDSTDLGQFTNDQLAAGINLATLATPMLAQADSVYTLIVQHDDLHFRRWRFIQVSNDGDPTPDVKLRQAELETAMDAEESGIVAKIRAAAQPVPHHYVLEKLK